MDTTTTILLITTLVFLTSTFFMGMAIWISGKWFTFGIKDYGFRIKYKQNLGYLCTVGVGNNLGLPEHINMSDKKLEKGKDTYVYNHDQFNGIRLFGRPFVIFPDKSNKTSAGIYYKKLDDTGKELVYQDKSKNNIKDNEGNNIPILSVMKPSIDLPTPLLQSIVAQEVLHNMKSKIYGLLDGVNKYILYGAVALIIAIAVSAYVSWQIYDVKVPEIITLLNSIKTACGK